MMRLALAAIVSAIVAAGCQQDPVSTEKDLATELRGYMGELQKWEPVEREVFQALADVERTHYVDDDFVVRRFKTALPKIEGHVGELDGYRPQDDDLLVIHERYVESWRDLKDGFDAVVAAMESKDYVRLAGAKNQIEGARRKLLSAFEALDALLTEVEPELKQLRRRDMAAQGREEPPANPPPARSGASGS